MWEEYVEMGAKTVWRAVWIEGQYTTRQFPPLALVSHFSDLGCLRLCKIFLPSPSILDALVHHIHSSNLTDF